MLAIGVMNTLMVPMIVVAIEKSDEWGSLAIFVIVFILKYPLRVILLMQKVDKEGTREIKRKRFWREVTKKAYV